MAQISLPEDVHDHLVDAQYKKEQSSICCYDLSADRFCSMVKELDQRKTVYIWDMDETLILLMSLINGTYGDAFDGSKDIKKGKELGRRWANRILEVSDRLFFYEQIGGFNEPYLDGLTEYDDGRDLSNYDFNSDGLGCAYDDATKRKLAYRHRVIAERYAQGLDGVLDQGTVKLWDDLYSLTDSYTDGWLSSAQSLLGECIENVPVRPHSLTNGSADSTNDTKGKCINVLVTSVPLIPSLVKCLLFRLNKCIPAGNVYSSCDVGKAQCFSWIRARFNNPNNQFCVIGDGPEEREAAKSMNWPFVQVDMRPTGDHRFPSLSMRTLKSYTDVAYGVPDAKKDP